MARSEARIAVSIWSDGDFLALSPLAQRMFMFLLSQPDLTHDGVLALRERRWSKTAAGLTPAQVSEHLAELVAARFIVIDEDTEELLIRSFIRRDKVYRQPNVLRAAADHLEVVTSPIIRAAIAEELRRVAAADDIGAGSASVVAEMLSTLGTPSGNPSPNPSGNPSGEGFGDAGEPFSKASRESSGHIDDSSEIVPQCGTEAETDKTATDSSAPYVSAARKGSGNPSGNPSPNPSAGTPGDRGVVTAVSSDSPFPFPLSPVPPTAERGVALALAVVESEPDTTQALVAEWINHCRKRPPRDVVGQVGKSIKNMLAEGIDPADIRRGLAAWHSKGLHPSTLSSVVNEVMNATPAARPSTTDQRVNAALALAARYAQEEAS